MKEETKVPELIANLKIENYKLKDRLNQIHKEVCLICEGCPLKEKCVEEDCRVFLIEQLTIEKEGKNNEEVK